MTEKKTIFLTGASGKMGQEGLKQLLQKRDRFTIVALVMPTDRDKKIMSPYAHEPGLKIVWGDLTNYADVLSCVTGADYILHVAALVSPLADHQPVLTTKVNIGSIQNILQAIKAQPDPQRIKLVTIGSVAQTGDRQPPIHWGRVGDPIKISIYDNYAITKTIAERLVIESGLHYWVSLRQTGMIYPNLLAMDPLMLQIAFHQPLNACFEWITVGNAGRLLANVCEKGVPEEFWGRVYNIGGGAQCRTTVHEFLQMSLAAVGISDYQKVTEPNWFVRRNFHGQWYEDSDILEAYLHFRSETVEDFIRQVKREAPFYTRLAKFVPPILIKKLLMQPIVQREGGTVHWVRTNHQDRISAFFGSIEAWQQIPGWDVFPLEQPSQVPMRLNHGYDETKPQNELDLSDMQQAAEFRGGRCLSTSMTTGDLRSQLSWQCAFEHTFKASPTLVLLAGHWCPQCMPAPWNYDAIAQRDPFFAQVWYPHHTPDEANFYAASILDEEFTRR